MPEQNSPIVTLTRALAEAFGEGWTAVPSPHSENVCHLAGPEACLTLNDPHPYTEREGTRARITTAIPLSIPEDLRADTNRRVEHSEITVAATRAAEDIVLDIQRRLLEAARTVHTTALAYLAQTQANIARRHQLRDELVALMPHTLVGKEKADSGETTMKTYTTRNSDVHADWRLNHDGSTVKVTLTGLTPQQALQIAPLLYPQNTTA